MLKNIRSGGFCQGIDDTVSLILCFSSDLVFRKICFGTVFTTDFVPELRWSWRCFRFLVICIFRNKNLDQSKPVMDDLVVEDIDELMKQHNPTDKTVFDLQQNIQALKLRQPKHPKIREAEQFLKTLQMSHLPRSTPRQTPHESNVQKLQKSLAMLAECETQADEIMAELKRNRESIQRSQEHVKQVRAQELPKAHRHTQSMLAWWK